MVNQQGTYALILEGRSSRNIQIGRLGRLALKPGYYLYVGSAFGPGGLKARLAHHLKPAPKPHWHIDYLRRYTKPVEIWYTTDSVRREGDWVANIINLAHAEIACPGFGASDSEDVSHLFSFPHKPDFAGFRRIIETVPNHAPVHSNRQISSIHDR